MTLTGRMVTRIVLSRETTNETTERVTMISHSFLLGFHASGAPPSAFSMPKKLETGELTAESGGDRGKDCLELFILSAERTPCNAGWMSS